MMNKKGAGLFGSRADGWTRAISEKEDVEEELALHSLEVHNAVRGWGRADLLQGSDVTIVKAGAHLTTHQGSRLHDGSSTSLATILLAAAKDDCDTGRSLSSPLVSIDMTGFSKVIDFGLSGGSGSELCEAVPILKKWCKEDDKASKCLLVTLR